MLYGQWNKVRDFVKWLIPFLVALFLLLGCGSAQPGEYQADGTDYQEAAVTGQAEETELSSSALTIDENGTYSGKEEVALFIHLYGKLPENYITKKEAGKAGWRSREGNLWEVAPGKSIGGSRFGNYEESLPEKDGRNWFECDINYQGGFRGEERLVYSDDGLIYYTPDHYKTFEQLY